MTTVLRADQGNLIDLTELPTDADVAGALHATNEEHGAGLPRLWRLTVEYAVDDHWGGAGPTVWLEAGTAGDTGALRWVDNTGEFVPALGARHLVTSQHGVDYLDWSGSPCSVHVALQVPIGLVYEAVAEVAEARHRPVCLSWTRVRDNLVLVGPRAEQRRIRRHA
jgi:hypothetical protein